MTEGARYTRHEEYEGVLDASPTEAFAFLDDPAHLSLHMANRSWMMGGSRMEIVTDDARGQRIGSRLHLGGTVLGMHLGVDAVIVDYNPPRRKRWETVGEPKILVIGAYRMDLELRMVGEGTSLRIAIDYELPQNGFPRILGHVAGRFYARWCTRAMVRDAALHFRRRR
ncbi:MAG: SRPBCC family protein [Gemmatimonadota bacterium]